MEKRKLGRSGIEVSALGMGCWAIGGPAWVGDKPVGWGKVDDGESARAINRALELGINFFDTADVYGCGHSERVLGKTLAGKWDDIVIATKFGRVFDEDTRQITGSDASAEHIKKACDASLARLGTDHIDLYQFHLGDWDMNEAATVRDVLEELVSEGKIRSYAWSTDDPERARIFAEGEHCTGVQYRMNILERADDMLKLCEENNLASVIRSPLAMGLLTGKFNHDSSIPDDDVRHGWDFNTGEINDRLVAIEVAYPCLDKEGRSLAQSAICWLWSTGEYVVPIPGFKTVEQVEENVAAMEHGPMPEEDVVEMNMMMGL